VTRRRWIADVVFGDRAALLGEHARHLVRTLRASVGQEFDIATGNSVRRGRITNVSDERVEFELGEEISAANPIKITLLLAVFKFDRMEWAIEKCTELGVVRILPVIAARTDKHLAEAAAKRGERWQRIALQAAEQSRRDAPPEIDSPLKLSQALNVPAPLRIVLAESEEQASLRDLATPDKKFAATEAQIALAIGPPGGWTGDELQSFQQAGWVSASLGDTILRAETAAIAATAIVASLIC
jgi:16S rRNA (uracil1498-N3)-methyltransferase